MEHLKSAVSIPQIKELDEQLDRDNLKNYRPVSNLPFVSKIIERVVANQLNNHMIKTVYTLTFNMVTRRVIQQRVF